MKIACAKCQSIESPPPPMVPVPEERPPIEEGQNPNAVYSNQPNFDAEKLHQAILAFRPVSEIFICKVNYYSNSFIFAD